MPSIAGYDVKQTHSIFYGGTTTNGTVTYPVLKTPFGGLTVTGVTVQALGSVAASGSNYVTFNLFNGGSVGTATTSIGTAGGTAGVADGPVAMTLTAANANTAAGDYLMFKVGRIGTITERDFALIVEWVAGQG